METCSSILAWEIPWTEEPGGLQSMGLHPRTGSFESEPLDHQEKSPSKKILTFSSDFLYQIDKRFRVMHGVPIFTGV